MALLLGAGHKQRCAAAYGMWRRLQHNRTMWVHPLNMMRAEKSEFVNLYQDFRQFPDRFFKMYRMYPNQFDHLLGKLRPGLEKKTTNYREPLTPEERLVITLT